MAINSGVPLTGLPGMKDSLTRIVNQQATIENNASCFYSDVENAIELGASLALFSNAYKEDVVFPLLPTDGSGDLTFTRASTATRVNSEGLIEKVRTNLVLNSIWNGVGTNIAPTSWGIGFSSGNFEAATNTENALSSAIRFYGTAARRYITQSSPVGTYIASFYVNAATTGLRIDNVVTSLNGSSISFLEDGLSISATKIIEAGKWYSIIFTNASISEFRIGGGVGFNGSYDFTISMPQWETGDVRTEYIPTTTTAVSVGMLANVPRIDYTGGGCGSLLLEKQSTNLALYSEQFDNAAWVKFGSASVVPNQAISPDGTQNADLLNVRSTNVIRQSVTLTASTTYSCSFFAKKTDYDIVGVQTLVSGSGVQSFFNLDTGVVSTQGSGHTASIKEYSNGWYRCIVSFNCGTSTSNIFDFLTDSTSLKGFYIYGAQLEASSYPTSYIPTLASSVTRLADVCNGAGTSATFNDSEGVLFFEGSVLDFSTTNSWISISESSNVNANQFNLRFVENLNLIQAVSRAEGLGQDVVLQHTLNDKTTINKIAIKYKLNDWALWVNGVEVDTESSSNAFTPNSLDVLDFHRGNNTNPFYGNVKQLMVFDEALSDSELATLTTL